MESLEEFIRKEMPEGRVVFLSPHDDDAAIGCGGLLSRLKERSSVIVMTDGALGSTDLKGEEELVKTRRNEAKAAYERIGVFDVEFLDFPDLCLNNYECWKTDGGRAGAYQKLIPLLRQKQPVCVFIPSAFDFHPDHKTTSRIGHAAAVFSNSYLSFSGRAQTTPVLNVWEYHVWSKGNCEGMMVELKLGNEESLVKKEAIMRFESQRLILEQLARDGLLDFSVERIVKKGRPGTPD
jgi:LmbE family N-acetylglucosaminyl deacetylase